MIFSTEQLAKLRFLSSDRLLVQVSIESTSSVHVLTIGSEGFRSGSTHISSVDFLSLNTLIPHFKGDHIPLWNQIQLGIPTVASYILQSLDLVLLTVKDSSPHGVPCVSVLRFLFSGLSLRLRNTSINIHPSTNLLFLSPLVSLESLESLSALLLRFFSSASLSFSFSALRSLSLSL